MPNKRRIRITSVPDLRKGMWDNFCDRNLMLRRARNVGDEEVVNNTVLSALRRYRGFNGGFTSDGRIFDFEELPLTVNEGRIRRIVNEELTKAEVKGMISDRLDSYMETREFKKAVNNIVADTIDDFFQGIWQRKNFWKNIIKKR